MAKPLVEALDPDQPLFEALRAGDEQVLPELIRRHGRWVRGVIYASIANAQDVEDVHQQVWLLVWRRSATLQDVSRWRYWVYRLARNAAIDAGRRNQRQKSLWQRFTGIVRQRPAHAEHESQRKLVIQEQYQAALKAIHGLPDLYRVPFVLRHLEGWTYRQIAETLGLPEDTVETRLVRGRRLLRAALGVTES